MNLSVVALIKLGYRYMQLWPKRAELAQYFPDYRPIQLARLVFNYAPAIGLLALVAQLALLTHAPLVQGIFYAVFFWSLPVQAMVMLGVQADKVLPPSLSAWYKEGVARYNEQGGNIKLSLHKPRYIDLATLLNMTYQRTK
ncbi:terminus macrodomain insulation protein YfbV [Thalassotalea euphylliae]|uniref:terminus macrodomain insulation protein YfbV n=1 Tax=Thalassotalea euphylliae TaxID=1655234 RepID=UPI003632AD99